jgi:hypothetical protein
MMNDEVRQRNCHGNTEFTEIIPIIFRVSVAKNSSLTNRNFNTLLIFYEYPARDKATMKLGKDIATETRNSRRLFHYFPCLRGKKFLTNRNFNTLLIFYKYPARDKATMKLGKDIATETRNSPRIFHYFPCLRGKKLFHLFYK